MNPRENWKTFESNIERHSRILQIPIIKIPNHYRRVRDMWIPQKTAFDFSCSIDGIACVFDAKCESKGQRFNLKSSFLKEDKIHQWINLQHWHDCGNLAGLLIWFFEMNLISFFDVPTIRGVIERGEKSLSPDTTGASCQSDSDPINLRQLLKIQRLILIQSKLLRQSQDEPTST